MNRAKLGSLVGLAILGIALLPLSVWAATEFDIVPKVSASWRYDSNYFRAQFNERPVFTYLVQPGLDLGINTAKSSVRLNYTLDAYWYDDRDTVPPLERKASSFDYVGQTGDLAIRYQAFDRLQVGLDDILRLTRDPGQSDQFSNSIIRAKYCLNAVTPLLVYEFGPKFNVALRYRNTKIDYLDPADIEDSDEHRGIFDFVYNFNRRNSIDLQYQVWHKLYEVSSDFTSNQVKLIFRRQMRSFDFIVGGGYQNRKFDDPGLGSAGVFTYNVSIDGEILENRRAYATLRAEQNLNDQAFGNDYFIATRFSLSGGYEFTSKLSADALASYQISDYQLTPRKDNTYIVSGNLNYRFARWVALNLAAGYENRDSNIPGLSYDNTFVIARLNFAYEIGRK
jgi:hypothetical protein